MISRARVNTVLMQIDSSIMHRKQKVLTSSKARKQNSEFDEKVKEHDRNIKVYKYTLSKQKVFLKDLIRAKDRRQVQVEDIVYAGFYNVKNIIPTGSDIDMDIQPDSVRLVKEVRGEKLSVSKRDGSAYNSMLSFTATANLLKVSRFLNIMIMDEYLSVVNPENSEEFSAYLPYITKGMLLIIIEQKEETVAKSGNIIEYSFKNVDGNTQIRRLS